MEYGIEDRMVLGHIHGIVLNVSVTHLISMHGARHLYDFVPGLVAALERYPPPPPPVDDCRIVELSIG